MLDKDQNGRLSADELKKYFVATGEDESKFDKIWKSILKKAKSNKDKSDDLNYEEFEAAVMSYT